MADLTKEQILAAVRLAEKTITGNVPSAALSLARAVLSLYAATKHYEGVITWEASCFGCAALLDKLYAADRRCEQAESALIVALARRKDR